VTSFVGFPARTSSHSADTGAVCPTWSARQDHPH